MDRNDQKIDVDEATRTLVADYLERSDVCLAQVERRTGIGYQRLKNFRTTTRFKEGDLRILKRMAEKGEPVARKKRENRKLIEVEEWLRNELAEYIQREDVCVSAVERDAGLTSGTLKRIADGETRYTRRKTINSIRRVVKKGKAKPAQSRNILDPDKVVQKFKEGAKPNRIAEEAGTTRQAVYHILKERGVKMSVPASDVAAAVRKYCAMHDIKVNTFCQKNKIDTSFMYSKGMMHKQHADRITRLLTKPPEGVPTAQKPLDPRRVLELKKQGLTHEKIADQLGVHVITVSRALRKLKR